MKKIYKIKAEHFLGATCDLADEIMQTKYSEKEYEKLIEQDENFSSCFTDEGQEIFNDILSNVENILHEYGIIHEEAE